MPLRISLRLLPVCLLQAWIERVCQSVQYSVSSKSVRANGCVSVPSTTVSLKTTTTSSSFSTFLAVFRVLVSHYRRPSTPLFLIDINNRNLTGLPLIGLGDMTNISYHDIWRHFCDTWHESWYLGLLTNCKNAMHCIKNNWTVEFNNIFIECLPKSNYNAEKEGKLNIILIVKVQYFNTCFQSEFTKINK